MWAFAEIEKEKEENEKKKKSPPHLFPSSLPLCFSDFDSWIISSELRTHRPPYYLPIWLTPLNLLWPISPSPLQVKKVKTWNFPRTVKSKREKVRPGPTKNYFLLKFCHCTFGLMVSLAQTKRWWVTILLLTHNDSHGNNSIPLPPPLKLQVRHTTEGKHNLPPKICLLGYWWF